MGWRQLLSNRSPHLHGQPQDGGAGMRCRQPLGPVAFREGNEVGDLLPLDINDLHQLARPGDESGAVPARNQNLPRLQIQS